MSTPLRLLLVEDSADDAELIRRELERVNFELEWRRLETEQEFREALDETWDLIISDFRMPQFDGLRAFALVKERGIETPFIFVSGALGEERAVEAMRAGARDYILKENLGRLEIAVTRELAEARNRIAKRRAEEAARQEQRRLAMAVEASGAGVFEYRLPPAEDTYHSGRWAEILGYSPDELPSYEGVLDWTLGQMHPDDVNVVTKAHRDLVEGRSKRYAVEVRMHHKQGHWVNVSQFAKAVERDAGGRMTHVVGVMLDVSDQRRLEAQLRQAQKMEAVGRLAGGVAHDFNNLLTAIFGFGGFVLERLQPGEPTYRDMQDVMKAAGKAESLTTQLLAFSRNKPTSPRVLNVNTVVEEMDRMLRRIIGEDIGFATILAQDPWNVRVDPGSFEQVVVNLAVNARDAMPEGGSLTVETANTELDKEYGPAHGAQVPAGQYVMFAMSDTGVGMDEETQRRMFEPFFTTKDAAIGTGLGLSTCYGIVKQAGGFIWVYSEPGRGTTFKVYLPRDAGEVETISDRPPREELGGTETILVVEDDTQVRRLAVYALSRLGYHVIEAAAGADALRKCETLEDTSIDLLITDVVMPDLSGPELAEKLLARRPGMKVMYMSGYTANMIVNRGVLDPGVRLLEKPFTPTVLAHKTREALDE